MNAELVEIFEGEIVDSEWTPQQAAGRIAQAWQGAVESIVETGRRLIEEKQRAGHGQWLKVVELLPFSQQTANKLVLIAQHPDISNHAHGRDLPPSWTTLYALTPLPPGEIPRRIQAREITSELDRAHAQEIAQGYLAAQQEALNAYSQAFDHLVAFVSWAKSYGGPPAHIPDNYASVSKVVSLAAEAQKITEEWGAK